LGNSELILIGRQMKCEQAKRKLVAYLDGELRERERLQIKKHLSQCAACRGEADRLQKTARFLKAQEHVMPRVDFETRLWERIQRVEDRQLSPQVVFERLGRAIVPVAVALSLIVGIIVGDLVGNITLSPPGTSQEEAYAIAIGLDNFQDSPPGSLSEVYLTLATTKEAKNQ